MVELAELFHRGALVLDTRLKGRGNLVIRVGRGEPCPYLSRDVQRSCRVVESLQVSPKGIPGRRLLSRDPQGEPEVLP